MTYGGPFDIGKLECELNLLKEEMNAEDFWLDLEKAGIVNRKYAKISKLITDISNTCKVITDVIIEGEDWDPTYQTGRFAGENRFKVFTLRRIPGWAGIQSIIDLPKSNSYYKLGDNAITIFPTKKITDWIKD